MIPVSRPFVPDRRRLDRYLDRALASGHLTNNGPLVRELTSRLEDYLGVSNLLLVANGTMALQVAFRAMDIQGEAVTSPFTFVATAAALKWQGITPAFADIDPRRLTLSPTHTRSAISDRTQAIVPVHVFGIPCDHQSLRKIAQDRNLKLVYDASHAFGATDKGQSLIAWGDAATLSFHATKLFHTVEGGAIRFQDTETLERARRIIQFGLPGSTGNAIDMLGLNGKMSEIHAAFGLANLDCIGEIIERRISVSHGYRKQLSQHVIFPVPATTDNAAYCPVIFDNPEVTTNVLAALDLAGIEARRYFHPSLHETPEFRDGSACPVASWTAERILCLPLSPDLDEADCIRISDVIKSAMD